MFEIWKFGLNHITWATFGPFRTICSAHQFLGLGLGQKNSAQGRFGPVSFGPPLGLGQPWAKLVYRPGPIWAGPGQAQTHPYLQSLTKHILQAGLASIKVHFSHAFEYRNEKNLNIYVHCNTFKAIELFRLRFEMSFLIKMASINESLRSFLVYVNFL